MPSSPLVLSVPPSLLPPPRVATDSTLVGATLARRVGAVDAALPWKPDAPSATPSHGAFNRGVAIRVRKCNGNLDNGNYPPPRTRVAACASSSSFFFVYSTHLVPTHETPRESIPPVLDSVARCAICVTRYTAVGNILVVSPARAILRRNRCARARIEREAPTTRRGKTRKTNGLSFLPYFFFFSRSLSIVNFIARRNRTSK